MKCLWRKWSWASFSNPYIASPTSQLILQSSSASPTSQLILQPFLCFIYVTGTSFTSPGEPPVCLCSAFLLGNCNSRIKKCNGNILIFLTWLYSQGYNIYVLPIQSLPFIYHLLPNVWKAACTIRASIFVDVPYWPPFSTDKFISCVVSGPSQWFFHFGEEIVIAGIHIGWVRWMFQNLPLPAAQEVRDSSSATPYIVMKNDGIVYHQMASCSSESMRLRSLRQSERTTARDPVQHKRWTYPCYMAEHQ